LELFTSLFGGGLIGVAEANPGPDTQIPPVVDVPGMQFNASVFRKEGKLFATVDATYNVSTRLGY